MGHGNSVATGGVGGMKGRSVTLVSGTHITASDKRNILEGIDYLRMIFAPIIEECPGTRPDYAGLKLRRKGSPKAYCIDPCASTPSQYAVTIHSNETTSYGKPLHRAAHVTVRVMGDEPLYPLRSAAGGPTAMPETVSQNEEGHQPLSPEQVEALLRFADDHGRNWKSALNHLWMRAAAPAILHGLRNSHGPSWLASYRLHR